MARNQLHNEQRNESREAEEKGKTLYLSIFNGIIFVLSEQRVLHFHFVLGTPNYIVAPPYPPIFEKKRIDTRVIQGTEEKDGTSFFSLNGSFLEVTLSNVERRGNWHSWMNMRKPRANSGSPHTLRDVRSTPKPAGAFLHWHLWTSQKRKEDYMWLMDFCTVRTLGILACVHVVLTHTDAYILCMHVCTWQMPRHVQTW